MLAHRTCHEDFAPHPLQEASLEQEQSMAERVAEYIDQNYARQISLRDVADAFGYSACHLTHTFSVRTGTPITAWIIKRRILAAQELLRESNVSVATACIAVGFNDLCYFTRQFVRHVGMTPGRFRSAMNGGARASRDNAARPR
jgi:AraC-like DNA-binding protein